MIDADVTELIARDPLPAGADMLEVVLRELERIFSRTAGLPRGVPGSGIAVSRPAHYLELLESIQVHGYHICGGADAYENSEIAANWHDAIYTPTLAAIDRLRLGPPIPGRAAWGPVPDSPPAPAGCVSLDRLSAPRADRRLGDRRRGAAPPTTVAGPRARFAGLVEGRRWQASSREVTARR